MTLLRHFLGVTTSLLLLGDTATAAETTRTVELHDANQCLSTMNASRTRAGLSALTPKKNGLPLGKVNDPAGWNAEATLEADEEVKDYGEIFAFYRQADGSTQPDCSGAVKEWQKGYSILNKTPPVDTSIDDEMINDKTVFFLSLYNPYEEVQGDCRVIVCTEPVSPAQQTQPNEKADSKTGSGLLCMTSPNPFNREKVFTQEQWDKIGEAVASRASFVAPSLVVFVAVLAGAFSF
ncbi:hypothetical protein Emed_002565 [Eimeria media]